MVITDELLEAAGFAFAAAERDLRIMGHVQFGRSSWSVRSLSGSGEPLIEFDDRRLASGYKLSLCLRAALEAAFGVEVKP